MTNKIKLILLALMMPMAVMSQINSVTFEFARGIDEGTLKTTMENQTTKLLTMLNESQAENKKTLNFKGINISDEARQTILQLWNYQHMRVWQDVEDEEPYISETCIRFGKNGYQVRNIPIHLYAVKGELKKEYTEVCINFDSNGRIVDFNITMDKKIYNDIIRNAKSVEDEANRKMLAHWMEQLCTAYNERDIGFFETIFSDDAVIITGVRKMERKKTDVRLRDQASFEYAEQTKQQYITKLRRILDPNVNPSINIVFGDDAKYRRHGGNPRYYMVDVTQYWNTTSYSDVGHLFVLWDFKDPDKPQILARVWQELDDTKKFTVKDFKSLPE